MGFFQFRALDRSGKEVFGTSAADNTNQLADILKGQGLFLVESKEEKRSDAPPAAVAPKGPWKESDEKADLKDVAIFTIELAIMVRTALPILEALESLEKKQSDPVFKKVLKSVAADVRQGQPLSQAFARFPRCFDEVYTSLLASGEATGQMALMLDRIGAYLNFRRELKAKIRSAVLYPAIVVLTALAAVIFLVVFVLPTFAEIFSQFEVDLPLPTRVLLFTSAHLRQWWYLYALWMGGLATLVRYWLKDPTRFKTLQRLQLRAPVFGVLARNIVMTRVLRTLGTLTAGGVPILKALELSRAAAGNAVFFDLLGNVYRSAAAGKGLAAAMSDSFYIPETVGNMIATAEKTGTLPEVLNKIADYYEGETDRSIRDVFVILEPMFVLLLGLVVGGVAISVLWPIFELGNSIQ